jgi:hypothetical protein
MIQLEVAKACDIAASASLSSLDVEEVAVDVTEEIEILNEADA